MRNKQTKLTLMFVLSLTMSWTSGCASTPATECAWTKIITVSKDDVLTRQTKEEIVAHNEKYESFCSQ